MKDKDKVWHYDSRPHGHPFYLQKLANKHIDDSAHDPELRMQNDSSYGGDLLIGYYGPNPVVRELDTKTKKTVWIYGEHQEQGKGDLWDRLYTPVRGFRYGINERGGGVTIIVDERARIFAVNRDKELVWDLGGSSGGNLLIATSYSMLPTYISATTRGTLLVTDWGRNMIYEIDPFHIPQRTEKDAYLFTDYETTNEFERYHRVAWLLAQAPSGLQQAEFQPRGEAGPGFAQYEGLAGHPCAVQIFGADRGRSYNDSRALELSEGPSQVVETRQLDPVRRVYHPAPLTGCTEAVDV